MSMVTALTILIAIAVSKAVAVIASRTVMAIVSIVVLTPVTKPIVIFTLLLPMMVVVVVWRSSESLLPESYQARRYLFCLYL